MKVDLIIPAAGCGKRFSGEVKKQFYEICGRPVLYYTFKIMGEAYPFSNIIAGIDKADYEVVRDIYGSTGLNIPFFSAEGGKKRAETVFNCLKSSKADMVAVHDAARPFVVKNHVEDAVEKAFRMGGAVCALKVRDTVKSAHGGEITGTVPRDGLYLAHTPQVFKREVLEEAMEKALKEGLEITDEASAFEAAGHKVAIASSSPENLKLTFAEDARLAELLVRKYFG